MELIERDLISRTVTRSMQQGLLDTDDTSVVYLDFRVLADRIARIRNSFSTNHSEVLHAAAIKANPLHFVLKWLVKSGAGLEAASLFELMLARDADADMSQLVFDSPAKTQAEIELLCREFRGARVNADSLAELRRYPMKDTGLNMGLRINPHVGSDSVSSMNVGGPESKFGESISSRESIVAACLAHPDLNALHVHIGSQFSNLQPTLQAIRTVVDLALEINDRAGKIRDHLCGYRRWISSELSGG